MKLCRKVVIRLLIVFALVASPATASERQADGTRSDEGRGADNRGKPDDKPRADKSSGDKPKARETPTAEKKGDDKPKAEKKADDKPTAEEKGDDKPTAEKKGDDRPKAGKKPEGKKADNKPEAEKTEDKPKARETKAEKPADRPKAEKKPAESQRPGGSVVQRNVAAADAKATTGSLTVQRDREGSGTQAADTTQRSSATGVATQSEPANASIGSGAVDQLNATLGSGVAVNESSTTQATRLRGSNRDQSSVQTATTTQAAEGIGVALQDRAANRTATAGGWGDVTQGNVSAAKGVAANRSATTQDAKLRQDATCKARCSQDVLTQSATQSASTTQTAAATAVAAQSQPVNATAVGGSGSGSIAQANTAGATAIATNHSTTDQKIDLKQRGCERFCYGTEMTQTATQTASTRQVAAAAAVAEQVGPLNSVLEPAPGTTVIQLTEAEAKALARDGSVTVQRIKLDQRGCKMHCYETVMTQTVNQTAVTQQEAASGAAATQIQPANAVQGGGGGGGWIEQVNAVTTTSAAGTTSTTLQVVKVRQRGCEKECFATVENQDVNQSSTTRQSEVTGSVAEQIGPVNQLVADAAPAATESLVLVLAEPAAQP
jgi:hypothetical protein